MYDVFVTYIESTEDMDITVDGIAADEIEKRLTKGGAKVFCAGGGEPDDQVEKALNEAKVMIVIASSEEQLARLGERGEWTRFIEQMNTRKGLLLITVLDGVPKEKRPAEFEKARKFTFGEAPKAARTALEKLGKDAEAADRKDNVRTEDSSEKKIKRIIAIVSGIISVVLIASTFFNFAHQSFWFFHALPVKVDGYKYLPQENGEYYLSGCKGDPYGVVVPSIVDGHPVTRVSEEAFKDCKKLTQVELPDGVDTIENNAFNGCDALEHVKMPEGLTFLANGAFRDCSKLKEISLPDGVRGIHSFAFYNCDSLTSIEFPSSVSFIDWNAFGECDNLTSVYIPATVTDIGIAAFGYCRNLTEINVSEDNRNYCSVDGVLYDKNMTVLCCCPAGKAGSFTVPDSVRTIETGAFEGSKISTIVIHNNVSTIKQGALGVDVSVYAPHDPSYYGYRADYSVKWNEQLN